MDLSAVIFVVLALAWAVYLIPKALKHHDELAGERLVEGHSDKVRILSRKSGAGRPEVVAIEVESTDTVEKTTTRPTEKSARTSDQAVPESGTVTKRPVTRGAARAAARRRRRVLCVLVLTLAVLAGLAAFAVVPRWTTLVPAVLVVLFLVVARLSVRAQQSSGPEAVGTSTVEQGHAERRAAVRPATQTATSPATGTGSQDVVDALAVDRTGQRREAEALLADDGSLWDPLPMTLPTYVNKARARRTVQTIELTGMNSSGHDDADTALARESEQSAQETHTAAEEEAAGRNAAGA